MLKLYRNILDRQGPIRFVLLLYIRLKHIQSNGFYSPNTACTGWSLQSKQTASASFWLCFKNPNDISLRCNEMLVYS